MDDRPPGNRSPKKDIKVLYLLSSPDGDHPIDMPILEQPFLLAPGKPHPNITLRHYFDAIRRFVLEEKWQPFLAVLNASGKEKIGPQEIGQILIRSEKHGALYHLTSIEVLGPDFRMKFALSTGVSRRGKDWLIHEFEVIRNLNRATMLPYLPRVYLNGEVRCPTGNGDEILVMSMAEWFEDYHEWHLSLDERKGGRKILIWDQYRGYSHASMPEGCEIYRQAAKILSLYYDTRTFSQIYPWHHGAGDFVVKRDKAKIEVRLTTARKYEPIMVFREEAGINPLVSLVYFFFNLTLQMRLDKLDGTGPVIWAEDWILTPVIEGFLDALRIKERQGSNNPIKVNELLLLLKGFSREELLRLLDSLMDLHRYRDPGDYEVIQSHLKAHGGALHECIQGIIG